MNLKKIILLGTAFLLIIPIGMERSLAQTPQSGQTAAVDQERCALMLRKGKEAFSRGRYSEAKEFFRKAVQADPGSREAWSYYDLAQMYSVAEQYKNHGRILHSTAPEPPPEMTQPQPPSPAPAAPPPIAAPKPVKEKDKAASKKKGKLAGPAESKPEETKEVKPPIPGSPAPVPLKPTPPPGGMKILKDEGC